MLETLTESVLHKMGPLTFSESSGTKTFTYALNIFFSDWGFSLGAGDCHGNRMQGGDLQQGFMIDVGGVEEDGEGLCWK